jgi:hypothetical protein
MSLTNPFGCGPGSPCRELLNQLKKYNIPEYYPTADSYLSCFTEDLIPCSAITHCISGTSTPILIVSNSAYITVLDTKEYIGGENGGFNSDVWNLTLPSLDVKYHNCGVPFPHSIHGGVSNAINVCGNLYINGNPATVDVEIKVYTFECFTAGTGTLQLLDTTTLTFPSVEDGNSQCWQTDIDCEDPISKCTTNLLISFSVPAEESGVEVMKTSYKVTIENTI